MTLFIPQGSLMAFFPLPAPLRRAIRRPVLPALVMATLPIALPASAHIHVSPTEVSAGQTVEIALEVGHGCSGSATTGLRIAVPDGLTDILIVPRPGWQVETPGNGRITEIRWTGGSLPDGTKATFAFVAKVEGAGSSGHAPALTPGDLTLPVVQICGETTVRWIDGPTSDHPAPRLRIAPAS